MRRVKHRGGAWPPPGVMIPFLALLLLGNFATALDALGTGRGRGRPPSGKPFIAGESVLLARFTAMPGGSVCRIRHTGTALDGTEIHTDPGALREPVAVKVFLNTGHLRYPGGVVYRPPVIGIRMDREARLTRPLRISVPEPAGAGSEPVIGFSIDGQGRLLPVVTTPPEMGGDGIRRFSLYTFHAGRFTWLSGPLKH